MRAPRFLASYMDAGGLPEQRGRLKIVNLRSGRHVVCPAVPLPASKRSLQVHRWLLRRAEVSSHVSDGGAQLWVLLFGRSWRLLEFHASL